MPRFDDFISTTDAPTLKNDGKGTLVVVMPGGQIVPGNSTVSYTFDLAIGQVGALLRMRIKSSKTGLEYVTQQLTVSNRSGTVSGSPAPYGIIAQVNRIDAVTLRATVFIQNPYSSTLIGEPGNETFTFTVNTFIAPFA